MTRLSALVVILALAFSSLAPATQVSSSTLPAANSVSEPLCGSPTTVRLLSEKNLDVGTVTVANGATTLYVTYTTQPNYKLTTTQVAVANTLAAIPGHQQRESRFPASFRIRKDMPTWHPSPTPSHSVA